MSTFITKSLKNKLVVLFLVISLTAMALVAAISYFVARGALENTFLNGFTAIAEAREMAITALFNMEMEVCQTFGVDGFIRDSLENIRKNSPDAEQVARKLSAYLKEHAAVGPDIYELFIVGMDGKVVASSDEANIGMDKTNDDYFIGGKKGPHIKDAHLADSTGKNSMAFSVPIKNTAIGETIGVIVARFEMKKLNEFTSNREGLGETGEVYIVNRDGYMITDSRFVRDAFLKQKVDTKPVKLFQAERKIMSGVYEDYRGVRVAGASMGDEIDEEFGLGWTLLAEIDADEAFAPVRALMVKTAWTALLVTFFIAVIAYFAAKAIADPISRVSLQIAKVGEGDLTQEIRAERTEDEIGILTAAAKKTVDNLKDIVSQVLGSAERVSSASQELSSSAQEMNATTEEVSSTVQQIAKGTETQAQRIEETQKVMEQMASSVNQVSKSAQDSAGQASLASAAAQKGGEAAREAQEKMTQISDIVAGSAEAVKKLGQRSDQIGEIVGVITNIADQTNLLALNAAIEAARAGEAGRGFAVVAEEVRKLAEGSAKAAEEIGKLIKEVQRETVEAVSNIEAASKETSVVKGIARKLGDNLEGIIKNTESVAVMIEQVSASSQEQAAGTKQVSKSVSDVASVAEETASATEEASASTEEMTASMEEMAASAQELADMGISLRELVGKFNIGDEAMSKIRETKDDGRMRKESRTADMREQAEAMRKRMRTLHTPR